MKNIIRVVMPGDKRGRILGFPTANLRYYKKDKIKFGVWVVTVSTLLTAGGLNGIALVGPVPTFNIKTPRIEIYLFNPPKNLYNKKISVEFLKYLRPVKKFEDKRSLVRQIKKDCKKALVILREWRQPKDPIE